ncbi:MAG: hypothetical protein QM820_09570 [Minicystis sp.]
MAAILVVAQIEVAGRLGGELRVGGVDVLLEQRGQAIGRVPAFERARVVLRAAGVAEPDAALGLDLPEIGPAVGGEEEGDAEAAGPGARGEAGVRGEHEGLAVTVGLVFEDGGDVGAELLGLDDGDGFEAGEEDVVGAALLGGPLGDRLVLPLLRARAGGVRERRGVGLPAGGAELGVDDAPRVGLAERDGLAGRGGALDGGLHRGGSLVRGARLHGGDLGGEAGFERGEIALALGLRLLGEGLPELALLRELGRELLGAEPRPRLGLGGGARGLGGRGALRQLAPEQLELLADGGVLARRIGRGDEGSGIEPGVVAEGALEPDGQLARHLELVERLLVIAEALVDGAVAREADAGEQALGDAREHAPLAEPGDEVRLRLTRDRVEAEPRGRALRQHLGEEAQLGQARSR